MSARLLKDPATVSSRIFVGHLQTDDVTKHELEEHFSKYGTIVGSLINRGFGFVQFENEESAQKAIQNENGSMFKGRRIDVRPAKKDSQNNSSSGNTNANSVGAGKSQTHNNHFNANKSFNNSNDSFNNRNQNYNSGNQPFMNKNQSFGNDDQNINNQKGGGNMSHQSADNEQFNENNQSRDIGNDQFSNTDHNSNNETEQFNNANQNRGMNNQFGNGNQNRNDQFGGPNQNKSNNSPFMQGGNQNRLTGGNQNRNQLNSGISNQNTMNNTSAIERRQVRRGTRGGKNRNKNLDNSSNNFRDRSPLNRTPRADEKTNRDWEHNKPGEKPRNNSFGRDSFTDSGARFDRDDFKTPNVRDVNMGFGSSNQPNDYQTSNIDKNDCEIIVVNRALTEYAEMIEARLKKNGLRADLLFPNEDVLLSQVLGNIASRGCLYAVVVTPTNQEHHSLTLNILHGLPQEHRNMPVEDAINLISRNFSNYKAGIRQIPLNTPALNDKHPDAIQALLNLLADNRQLTVLQYDRIIKYLEIKREEQVQVELGDAKDLPPTTIAVSDPKQAELQSRILNILNSNKTSSTAPIPCPVPAPVSLPTPVPPTTWAPASSSVVSTSTTSSGVSPSPLLNDPTVQKALDSLLQGNLLKNIGDQQPPTTSTPLFAAFPNVGRF